MQQQENDGAHNDEDLVCLKREWSSAVSGTLSVDGLQQAAAFSKKRSSSFQLFFASLRLRPSVTMIIFISSTFKRSFGGF